MVLATFRRFHLLPLFILAAACSGSGGGPTDPGMPAMCSGYTDWQGSSYVLPYPVGSSYEVMTGNCDPAHSGTNRYGYDFRMEIGTLITAVRGGTVVEVIEEWPDSTTSGSFNNGVVIEQDDGTFANYWHLTQNGVLVELGDRVEQGQPIARSGASGTGPEHLHLHVSQCSPGCGSEPVTFRNTEPNPTGLTSGRFWPALPYDPAADSAPSAATAPDRGAAGAWDRPAGGAGGSAVGPGGRGVDPATPPVRQRRPR